MYSLKYMFYSSYKVNVGLEVHVSRHHQPLQKFYVCSWMDEIFMQATVLLISDLSHGCYNGTMDHISTGADCP